jgi:hypothetical protein
MVGHGIHGKAETTETLLGRGTRPDDKPDVDPQRPEFSGQIPEMLLAATPPLIIIYQ